MNKNQFTEISRVAAVIANSVFGCCAPGAMENRILELVQAVLYYDYETTVEDGSSTSIVPEIGIPGTAFSVGFGIETEAVRNLVWDRGRVVEGHVYQTESYTADSYVAQPAKGWTDLTANALGGLWDLVKDAVSWSASRSRQAQTGSLA